MKITGKKFGRRGEEIARNYLIAKGYKIEASNWRRSRFEIDIVASKDNVLAFIEVKSSRAEVLGPPGLRVNKTKQKKIAEAASEYLMELKTIPENLRFDVISILMKPDKGPEVTHIESAYVLEQDL
ncbi:MAG: YraN family protein [Candidatus Zixiibacteriota bacterium]|nr:MAG: YraN family protein [candidate division Zixibacteria bacterium]